ncbi:hypothetical protein KJ973_03225 [Patescibacteria group bacterium]|nr:hypothetical protein [Patescibacteria group bacterium]MBU1246640.1 hypothetical protein [Patescibacteria group bacterium]MBU1519676.1 hypothetical protein [Patescibacteria group bacterium]MBU1730547.1 hypothetical protein [Patescibacteria group bacterium]MBU1956130.1 hypothetical protein [Patescibacteria group bacterium]
MITFIKQKIKRIASFFGLVFMIIMMPSVSFAAVTTLSEIETAVLEFLNKIPAILVALAVVFFLWSVIRFIKAGDNEDARTQGKALITYGVIAIAVMVSLWGLIGLLADTFDTKNKPAGTPPAIPSPPL